MKDKQTWAFADSARTITNNHKIYTNMDFLRVHIHVLSKTYYRKIRDKQNKDFSENEHNKKQTIVKDIQIMDFADSE